MTTPAPAARPLRKDAAENRERVLEAAAQVFAEQGLDAGVDEVARVAGVGMGTLYRRFPTKQALVAELVRELLRAVLADARAALQPRDGTGLRLFLEAAGRHQSSNPGCLPRMWNTDSDSELIGEIRAVVAALLTDAQEHGRVRGDLTPTDISVVLW